MQKAVAPDGQRQQPPGLIDEPDRRLPMQGLVAVVGVGASGQGRRGAFVDAASGQTAQASGPMSAPWLTRSAPAAVTTAAGQSGSRASSGCSATVRAAAGASGAGSGTASVDREAGRCRCAAARRGGRRTRAPRRRRGPGCGRRTPPTCADRSSRCRPRARPASTPSASPGPAPAPPPRRGGPAGGRARRRSSWPNRPAASAAACRAARPARSRRRASRSAGTGAGGPSGSPCAIAGRGGEAEAHRGAIALVVAGQVRRQPGGAADDDHDDTAGQGIERAGVADAAFVEDAADAADDVVRGRPFRLVDDDQARRGPRRAGRRAPTGSRAR